MLHYSVSAENAREFFSLWNSVLCLFKISYIKSKVTQDHSETINLFSMWNKANDATFSHKFYLQDNMFWLFAKDSRRRRLRSTFSGIYWRAISYFQDGSSLGCPREKKFAITYFIRLQASERAIKIILTMGMFFPVKCFHDEIELRVKLNLPSGHSQRVYFVSFPHSPQLDSHKLCRRRLRTILHRFRLCIFSYWSCVRRDVLALSHPTVL